MKLNAALAMLLAGAGLLLLVPEETGPLRRWLGRFSAASAMFVAVLTLVEQVGGWDIGPDRPLGRGPPEVAATGSSNQMGPPASMSFVLAGAALLVLTGRGRRGAWIAQGLAMAICLVALLPVVAYLYGVHTPYGLTRYTGIALSTALTLLMLAGGLLCARPERGLMSLVTADDPGGMVIRRLLLPMPLLIVLVGWLCLLGERHGLGEAAVGTTLLSITMLAVLAGYAGFKLSRTAAAERAAQLAVRRQAAELQAMARFPEENPNPVLRLGPEGQVLYANRAAAALLAETQIAGEGPMSQTLWAAMHEAMRAGNAREMDVRCARGRVFSFLCVPLMEKGYINLYGRDMTDTRHAQQALSESEHRLRATFDHAGVGLAEVDSDDRFVAVNDRLCQILGYRREELLRMSVHELTAPEDRARSDELNAQLHQGHCDRIDYEKRYLKRDGSPLWARVTVSPIRDPAGRWLRSIGTIEDISQRKVAEEALRDSERKYRIVADNTSDWEFWLSPEGQFIYTSPSCLRVTGYDAAAFMADPGLMDRIIHPEDRALYRAHRGSGHEACATNEVEFRIVRRDGGIRWIDHACAPVYDSGGQFLGTRGSNRDVTARKLAEEEGQRSEELRRLALRAAAMGTWDWNPDSGRMYWDERTRAIYGVPTGEMTYTQVLEELVYPEDVPLVERAVRRALDPSLDGVYDVEHRIVWPDRSVHWVAAKGQAQFRTETDSRRAVRLVGTVIDIDARKAAEEALIAARHSAEGARAAAEEASRAKDRFLAVLSHELRTPLTPVLAAVTLMEKRANLTPELREEIGGIRRNVELEARLISDLLDMTRLSRGKIELHREVLDVHAVMRMAMDMFQDEIRSKELAVAFNLRAADPYVWADPTRIQQVLWNLVGNAVKFTPPGGNIVLRSSNGDGRLRIEVTDTGMGIEPEKLRTIFSPFEQGERTLVRGMGGLGLGLSISRSLVEMHQGLLTAFSEGRDRGATFAMELSTVPAAERKGAPPPAVTPQVIPMGLRILLVEDHDDTARLLARLLRSFGHTVQTAGGVAAALELAATREFDLLLSDIGLPDGNGCDLMRQLKDRYGIKGIAVSGFGADDDLRRSREAGFEQHLTKPLDFQLLEAVIAQVASAR